MATTTTNHRQRQVPASAAGDDSSSSAIDNLLRCPVCSNEFNAPKLLPCLHSYCFECLESSLAQSHIGPGQAFLCPLCKTQCVVPPRGVRAMKSNVFLVTLQVSKRTRLTATRELTCGMGRESRTEDVGHSVIGHSLETVM